MVETKLRRTHEKAFDLVFMAFNDRGRDRREVNRQNLHQLYYGLFSQEARTLIKRFRFELS